MGFNSAVFFLVIRILVLSFLVFLLAWLIFAVINTEPFYFARSSPVLRLMAARDVWLEENCTFAFLGQYLIW